MKKMTPMKTNTKKPAPKTKPKSTDEIREIYKKKYGGK